MSSAALCNASAKPGGGGVCTIVTYDHGRSRAGGFTRQRLTKIDQADLSAKHQATVSCGLVPEFHIAGVFPLTPCVGIGVSKL
jgi:hypothetical protein